MGKRTAWDWARREARVERCYEWIESLTPPNTLNSLSQAAAAVCGMRGTGWELLDSWILEACGLISRTKPTQWGGADVPPLHPLLLLRWNFLPARERGGSKFVLPWYGCKRSLQDCVWGFLTCSSKLCLCTVSIVSAMWMELPPRRSLLAAVRPFIFLDIRRWTRIETGFDHETLEERHLKTASLAAWEMFFSLTKRKLTARQCLSKCDYGEDYVSSPPP